MCSMCLIKFPISFHSNPLRMYGHWTSKVIKLRWCVKFMSIAMSTFVNLFIILDAHTDFPVLNSFEKVFPHCFSLIGYLIHWSMNMNKTNGLSLEMTSVACAVGPNVTMSSTKFSFQNLVFWNLFEFLVAKII
jgi:hypothetical protein